MMAMSSTWPAGTSKQTEKTVSGTNHRLLKKSLTASQTGHSETAAWNRRKEAKGKLRERYIAGRGERATNRVARKSVQTEEHERERSVVIAKDKRPCGSGDLCAPLFRPPSQLVALLGISAHMGPGNFLLL
jgi:hypothetical protein